MEAPHVVRALDYIDENLCGDLSVETLARQSGVSTFHFHRLFRADVGESPKQYVRRLRLERAALWLDGSRRPVTEVAFAAGYATHEAFTRAFKARFGVPPARFRRAPPPLEKPKPDELRIETLAPRRIAFIRHVGPYDGITAAFERLSAWAARREIPLGQWLGVFLDDQGITAPDRTRCHAARVVGEDVVGEGEIAVRTLAGGDYAVFEHAGSVRERRRLYALTYRTWLPALRREHADAPPFELFDEAVTRVHVPLEPR